MKDDLINNAEQMNDYCREKRFDKWFETSAKENINIDASIKYLIDEVINLFLYRLFIFSFLDNETYK